MNKSLPFLLVPLAALLVAGSALAQDASSRISHACTGAKLATDPAALCADDVVNDRPGFSTIVVTRPPPVIVTGESLTTGAGPAIQPGQDVTGKPPLGAPNISGAASTGTSTSITTGTSTGTAGAPARR